ncbi:MAG TPA: nitrilase-related carbon-nitrogen hydrolase, partial [Hyphomicrobium sp.]
MTAPSSLKIALAQLNPVVGDLKGNAKLAADAHARAKTLGADVIVFSELFLNGYPPEDLVLKPAFQDATRAELERLAVACADGPAILIGAIWRDAGKVYNAVALLDCGRIEAVTLKFDLPNYGVFDEKRV